MEAVVVSVINASQIASIDSDGTWAYTDGSNHKTECIQNPLECQLFILATDQGFINQTELVWEKLNEVNGDTVFMNSNFKKFNAENNETRIWNEQNAMTNTADYIASIGNLAPGETGFNSDLQLAIALQQQEFEQQQQQQPPPSPRVLPQSPTTSRSGLVVGPQNVHPSRPRNSSTSSRQESKPSKDKDKCTVM